MFCLFFPSVNRSSYVYRTLEFVERGHEAVIITGGGVEEIETDLEIYRVPIKKYENEFLNSYLNLLVYFVFGLYYGIKLSEKHDFDLIRADFADVPGPVAATVSRLYRTPFILYVHGRGLLEREDIDRTDFRGGEPRGALKRRMLEWVYDRAHTIFVNSDLTRNLMADTGKSVLLPPPVKISEYRPDEKEDLFISVCDISEQKNLQKAIEGFKKSGSKAEYLIVGEGEKRKKLQDKYGDGKIRFTGKICEEDLKKEYSRSKILILPSFVETFGVVYIEGLASGCPVIASEKLSGAREIIEEGKEGILVDPDSVEEISSAISRIEDDFDRMSKNAVDRAEEYSVEHLTDRMIDFYEDTLRIQGCQV